MAAASTTIVATTINNRNFPTNLIHTEYGVFVIASTPIRSPHVGAIRAIIELAAAYAITTISLPTFAKSAKGAIIPIESVASAELDGTKNESTRYTIYVAVEKTTVDVPV